MCYVCTCSLMYVCVAIAIEDLLLASEQLHEFINTMQYM